MVRILVTLLVVAFLCVSLSAQCPSTCDKKEGQTCGDKKDGVCEKGDKCCKNNKDGVCEKGDKCCKNKEGKKIAKVVSVVKCEKSGKEVACIKLSKGQYEALQKHFEGKDKEGKEHKFFYLNLSKVQKAGIQEVLKVAARNRVPVQKNEVLDTHVWIIPLEKAALILGQKDKAEEKEEAKS